MARPCAADDFAAIRARMEELKMARPRAADDFAAIRARMEELKRERKQRERKEDVTWNKDAERLDERRWQVSDVLRARALKNWPA
nr:hypothetical protein Hi04_10k_c5482_00047 [uncultured bacterium]